MILEHLDNNGGGSSGNSSTSKIDGYIRDMKISPDGQRIAVTFSGKAILVLKLFSFWYELINSLYYKWSTCWL